jgi:hypothetical protein
LLRDEEASLSKPKSSPKSPKAKKPAGPGAIAAGGGLGEESAQPQAEQEGTESYAATGIDNALDLLEVVTAKMDKASVGQQAAGIENHPEVRSFRASLGIILTEQPSTASIQGIAHLPPLLSRCA